MEIEEQERILERAGKIAPITSGRTDQQKAEELRAELIKLLDQVGELMTRGQQDGLHVSFQFGPPDSFKRVNLASLEILKKLC